MSVKICLSYSVSLKSTWVGFCFSNTKNIIKEIKVSSFYYDIKHNYHIKLFLTSALFILFSKYANRYQYLLLYFLIVNYYLCVYACAYMFVCVSMGVNIL